MKKIYFVIIILIFIKIDITGYSGKIIYSSNRTGTYQIYILDVPSGIETNLSNNSYDELNPKVSRDGKYIVFYSNRGGNNSIYKMDLSTLTVTELTTGVFKSASNYDPVFSPDGTKIAFKSNINDGYGDIFIMNSDGSNPINLTYDMNTTEEWAPDFTRDGDHIIFTRRMVQGDPTTDQIYIMNADGTSPTALTNDSLTNWYPRGHPADDLIMFVSKDSPGGNDKIFTMNYSGINKSVISTNLPLGDNDDPCYSFDGNLIIFINNYSGYYQVYMMNSNGENIIQLTSNTGYNILCPAFIPTEATLTITPTNYFTATSTQTPIFTFTSTLTPQSTMTVTPTLTGTLQPTITVTPTLTNTAVISGQLVINNVAIYPNPYNPSKGDLRIRLEIQGISKIARVKIYTMGFRVINEVKVAGNYITGINSIYIDSRYLMKLANGIYYIVVSMVDERGKQVNSKPQVLMVLK